MSLDLVGVLDGACPRVGPREDVVLDLVENLLQSFVD